MKFFKLSFWVVHGKQFIDLQDKSSHWFLYSGSTGIQKRN